jgi:hypothetical protein
MIMATPCSWKLSFHNNKLIHNKRSIVKKNLKVNSQQILLCFSHMCLSKLFGNFVELILRKIYRSIFGILKFL